MSWISRLEVVGHFDGELRVVHGRAANRLMRQRARRDKKWWGRRQETGSPATLPRGSHRTG
jgi:hypothetical protein